MRIAESMRNGSIGHVVAGSNLDKVKYIAPPLTGCDSHRSTMPEFGGNSPITPFPGPLITKCDGPISTARRQWGFRVRSRLL